MAAGSNAPSAAGPQQGFQLERTTSGIEIVGFPVVEHPAQDAQREPDDPNDDRAETASIGNQRSPLSATRLLVAFPALCAVLFVSFFDQTSVSTALPKISADLDTGEATSWIGTSFLISSTAFMLISGRLSDIFGRKNLLFVCLSLLAIGDLLCGFAKTPIQLFVFRALAGIGGGGVNSLVMIIVADITTLQNRGLYQGLIGVVHALANGTGPFIGGALVEKVSWNWIFFIVPILSLPAAAVIWFALPLRHDKGNYGEKIKKIDFGGIALNLASVILLLIPLSGGGVTYAWDSAFFIAMFTVGGLLWVAFVVYEWKVAAIPIMPLRLYAAPHCPALYLQSFLQGVCFFGNFFYLPLYFQTILAYPAIVSGALFLPYVLLVSVASITCGWYMSNYFYYMPPVVAGFFLWTLGNGLTCMFNRHTTLGAIIPVLIVEGLGTGFVLQPTLVGALANTKMEDRAVCTGLRNFMRTVGGSFGLVISGAILSNTLSNRLSGYSWVNKSMLASLTSSTYSADKLGLRPDEMSVVLDVYMEGLRYTFILYTVCTGVALLACLWIGNTYLGKPKGSAPEEGDEEGEAREITPPKKDDGPSRAEKGIVSGESAKEKEEK